LVRVSLWVPCWTNYQTYQGNPCGVYPDLSSFTGSGVIQKLYSLYQVIRPVRFTSSFVPRFSFKKNTSNLSSFTRSGVYPDLSSFTGSGVIQKLYSLYQAIRPVRFTSSGIRASALDTGSILSYPIIFLCNLSRFVFCPCSVICFLVCVLLRSCLCLCFVLVLVTFVFLLLFLFLVSFRLCVKKKIVWVLFQVKNKKLQKFWKKKRSKEEREKKRKWVFDLWTRNWGS